MIELDFEYGIGTPEELRQRKLQFTTNDPSILAKELEAKGKIIVPRFIGVYQDMTIPEDAEIDPDLVEYMSSSLRKCVDLLLSKSGKKDNLHGSLFHVSYNPNIWNQELVREAMGDNLGRIAYSTIDSIPDFNKKNLLDLVGSHMPFRDLSIDDIEIFHKSLREIK